MMLRVAVSAHSATDGAAHFFWKYHDPSHPLYDPAEAALYGDTLREVNPRKHMMEEMGAAYMAHGLVTLAGSRLYTSAADTDDIMEALAEWLSESAES